MVFFFALFLASPFLIQAVDSEPVNLDVVVIDPEAMILASPTPASLAGSALEVVSKNRLENALAKQKIGALTPLNFLKHAVRLAIKSGFQTDTVVLILLLPLVGIILSALYYLVGLTGFGIFMPAMIAVSFLATGIPAGLVLFAIILLLTLLAKNLLRKVHLHYRSRRAITLWVVCFGTFVIFSFSSVLRIFDLTRISIFPLLFMILLSEEFFRFQSGLSRKKAVSLTTGTLFISIAGAFLMSWQWLQELVILYPEISSLLILLTGFAIGRYTGFRLTDYKRFRPIWKK